MRVSMNMAAKIFLKQSYGPYPGAKKTKFAGYQKMGIKKHVYAVHQTKKEQLIFQWHFIPETRQNYKSQKTRDEVSKCYY